MICYRCGDSVPAGKTSCPACGAPVRNEDVCGGFWGLTSDSSATDKSAPFVPPIQNREAIRNEPPSSGTRQKKSRRKHLAVPVLSVLCAILFAFGIAMAVKAVHNSVRNDEYTALAERCNALGQQLMDAEAERNVLISQIDKLNAENANLEKAWSMTQFQRDFFGHFTFSGVDDRKDIRLTGTDPQSGYYEDFTVSDQTG